MGGVCRISEFAERGLSVSTVRRWKAEGRITARRLPSGQAIVHMFSCLLYRLRPYEKELTGSDLTVEGDR